MGFKLPGVKELQKMGEELGFSLDKDTAGVLLQHMQPFAGGYEYLDQVADALPVSPYQHREYTTPDPKENEYNAWLVKCHIQGETSGPLAGKTVVVKDNIFVQGLPLTDGSDVLADLVADFDATVVDRVLKSGGTIVGKSVCEYMCLSGGSATSRNGIVQNPRKPGYSTGGSSSGSAALVAAGEVDIGLGTDQGGSVRIPASWCGIVGMKATTGVVPYTGGVPIEARIDYIGPLTRTVEENAAALTVLADNGTDYTSKLGESITGLKIGILQEGFGQETSEPEVDEAVRAAAAKLQEAGAMVEEVSVPGHLPGIGVWGAIVTDGFWQALKLNGLGYNYESIYSPALYEQMQEWTARTGPAPINAKLLWLLGKHVDSYKGYYYAKAKNLARQLAAEYDRVLTGYDLLLMPTTVRRALKNPESLETASTDQIMDIAFGNTGNTCQFNATGHPAISVPCAMRDGLPVGLMLVGDYGEEGKIYQVAQACEQIGD